MRSTRKRRRYASSLRRMRSTGSTVSAFWTTATVCTTRMPSSFSRTWAVRGSARGCARTGASVHCTGATARAASVRLLWAARSSGTASTKKRTKASRSRFPGGPPRSANSPLRPCAAWTRPPAWRSKLSIRRLPRKSCAACARSRKSPTFSRSTCANTPTCALSTTTCRSMLPTPSRALPNTPSMDL